MIIGVKTLRIKQVSAKNFRTLQHIEIPLDHDYSAISGRNNCGKSAVLRIISHFLIKDRGNPLFPFSDDSIEYDKDITKWVTHGKENIEISISVEISDEKDSEISFVIKSYVKDLVDESTLELKIHREFIPDGTSKLTCKVNETAVDDRTASEILKKIRSSNAVIFHNSVSPGRSFFFGGQGMLEVVEAHFSAADREKISTAQSNLQAKIKAATKQHKGEIDKLLGKLKDKYQVELTSVEGGKTSSFSLEVKLADKSVDVPLKDWGAGTQNRTRLLMTLLEAIRKKSHSEAQERLTPVLLVEEPESFLHPSAQSDFGQVLAALAEEHGIQIIATTHSPYMLNVKRPAANILLDRKTFRGALKETTLVTTAGEKWMLPFSKILGVVPDDFAGWAEIFGAKSGKVILVEGAIDVEYFRFFRDDHPEVYQISSDVEVLPYNGKDALKNTQILKFMMSRMDRAFITFDLDARDDVQKKLEAIELVEERDFIAIGKFEAGAGNIEGLVPKQILAKVYAENVALVQSMGSPNTKEKNAARDSLKSKVLSETKRSDLAAKDFVEFKRMFTRIDKALRTSNT